MKYYNVKEDLKNMMFYFYGPNKTSGRGLGKSNLGKPEKIPSEVSSSNCKKTTPLWGFPRLSSPTRRHMDFPKSPEKLAAWPSSEGTVKTSLVTFATTQDRFSQPELKKSSGNTTTKTIYGNYNPTAKVTIAGFALTYRSKLEFCENVLRISTSCTQR